MIKSVNSIPAFDIKEQYATIETEVSAAVLGVLASGRYIGGPAVTDFEQQFAAYHGVSECVACNSGTDALFLALRALGIGAGDEVITTPFTFFATTEVISAVGAIPVFVDIDATTFNLDVEKLKAAITPKTKGIIPVHLFGLPVEMTGLMAIAQSYNLAVIEDCAQATGASWENQKVGSIGHVGCFSFYPTKNLGGCGDGGAIITNDPAIATQLRILREHGSKVRYIHEEIGVNSRLDAIQAVILQIKLRYLDIWNRRRKQIADYYYQHLSLVSGITVPQESPGGVGVWNQYTIRVSGEGRNGISGKYRDWVKNQMQEQGVNSMIYYPLPIHLQPVYKNLGYQPGQLPVSEQACHEVLSLPMFPELDQEQQDKVINTLKYCLS
ncbi:DegT/DnrJ/EryC1/StrS family aminotransferase [Dolichospermum circinale CS-1225]|uniref:DegT/DnrJ/EryC1/StrS family aminotransferase n=1 Tax=Dolichospermum circinale TaxID=109265 RepID=UPI000417D868|nr:DegT/DnrJ/EryC1/StrS family aminotransferase [Dolichospermum circinale]MDB9460294.1 DegT/DnrJ/EryC1/StrS family aminotransferase [Dolichospermum circinale CS-545/17]MDB9465532.1 DegT/DnrJ/EryC1/StrS family aminotransferase [Dolichospermum circinale CS-539/09]MDB9472610.1 DegT/DnrJ/EryC1/StrS family aminotransferase [Dolichospermum circinale CS-539]MDB9521716.1 DegT/DnrJ/EryC1/StrS family aminotransferase [Dolichospermum circinale CS-1225]